MWAETVKTDRRLIDWTRGNMNELIMLDQKLLKRTVN